MNSEHKEEDNISQEPIYHTISGGPETLHEETIKQKEGAGHQIVDQISQSPIVEGVSSGLSQEGGIKSEAFSPIPATQQNIVAEVRESFFDRHITAMVFFVNVLACISPYFLYFLFVILSGFGVRVYDRTFIIFLLPLSIFVFTILLGAFNFHGKRKEIFKGIGFILLTIITISMVGFALCLPFINGG